jgi:hypothetical protein
MSPAPVLRRGVPAEIRRRPVLIVEVDDDIGRARDRLENHHAVRSYAVVPVADTTYRLRLCHTFEGNFTAVEEHEVVPRTGHLRER